MREACSVVRVVFMTSFLYDFIFEQSPETDAPTQQRHVAMSRLHTIPRTCVAPPHGTKSPPGNECRLASQGRNQVHWLQIGYCIGTCDAKHPRHG